MEMLILIGGLLYVAVLGFHLMGRVDGFLKDGGFRTGEEKALDTASPERAAPKQPASRRTAGRAGRRPVFLNAFRHL